MSPNVRQEWRDLIRDTDDPAVDAVALEVVFTLDRFMSPEGRTHTGVRRLAKLSRRNKDTVSDRLGRLVDASWLKRTWPGRGHATTYEVSDPFGHLRQREVSDPTGQSVRPGRTDPERTRAAPRGRPPRGGGVSAAGTKASSANGKHPDGTCEYCHGIPIDPPCGECTTALETDAATP
jgi:hypothetical protein